MPIIAHANPRTAACRTIGRTAAVAALWAGQATHADRAAAGRRSAAHCAHVAVQRKRYARECLQAATWERGGYRHVAAALLNSAGEWRRQALIYAADAAAWTAAAEHFAHLAKIGDDNRPPLR